jgi:hypothetical protein
MIEKGREEFAKEPLKASFGNATLMPKLIEYTF